jgi:hypothetical protein
MLLVLLTLWGDAALNTRDVLAATAFGPEGRLVEPIVYSDGERTRNLVITSAPDGRWWIMHAERLAREGGWRIRHTANDNAPDGREVHWSSLQLWNLIGLGKLLGPWKPWPDLSAIEWAALFVGPVILFLFMLLGMVVCDRAFGRAVALAFPLGILGARALQYFFRAGEADHHGLVSMFAMFSILLPVAGRLGLTRPDGPRPARAWFVWAGIAGAAGLWVSAATQLPVVAATGLGVLLASWIVSRRSPAALDPSVWRWWGWSAGLASLGFYVLEYFPSHMGWRLEVNHPVYSLAWVAGGELLARCVEGLRDHRWPLRTVRDHGVAGLCAALVVLPAVMILIGGERFFVISNSFLFALHDYFINEFQSAFGSIATAGLMSVLLTYALILPTVAVAGLAVVRSGLTRSALALIAFAAVPAAVMIGLALHQVRWSGTAMALCLPLIMTCLAALAPPTSPAPSWRWIAAWAALVLAALPAPAIAIVRLMDQLENWNSVDKAQVPSVLTRDICQRIAASRPDARPVVLASPSSTTEVIYYGGTKGIGTLYWENLAGLRVGAEIYAARDDVKALDLLKKHGITHILLFSWDSFGQRYARLDRGLGRDDEVRDGFIAGLLEGTRPQPVWLNPLWYPIPPEYELGDDQWVRIYEMVPGQSRAQWLYNVGVYQIDAGKPELAMRSFRESITLDGKDPAPHLALVMMVAAQGDKAALEADVRGMEAALGAGARETLANAARQLQEAGQAETAAMITEALGKPR